jgi:3-mercaptopyruvate sulfurtransferase SseA
MLTRARPCFLAVLACGLLGAHPLFAAEKPGSHLVTAQWLEKNLADPDIVILDASPKKIYDAKHIPGAMPVDFFVYGFPEPPLPEMERRYQAWGVSPGKTIVMYDQGGTFLATRIFFSLLHHGFPAENLLVLDGGLAKWEELGLPVTTDPTPARAKGTFRITKVNEDVRVRLPEFLAATADPANNVLLEALGPDWHFGEVVAFERGGHVPHATLLPSADFFNPDKTFKSAVEIRRMLAYLDIRPEQNILSHCGGGVSASVPFFALKFLVNYPNVRLFVESQMGYLSDERGLPYWTYDVPTLLRQASWLQSWGGQMMRRYGGAKVSVLDLRPAAAFSEGHVPFALNIQADVFKSHLSNPDRLADILGPAGVDPAHEAVVISGAGLTKEAALAFLMLERLGQKKASVLADSLDQWARRGFTLTKDPTVLGPRTPANPLAIPPAAYTEKPRRDVIIGDARATRGMYPKVFIASGPNVPAGAPEGVVVHVPYTDLLTSDGSPKEAKDIWNILTKAGVPRYAELVCFSDDPGEAALNYFVLRLMGYPDVKVLIPAAEPSLEP